MYDFLLLVGLDKKVYAYDFLLLMVLVNLLLFDLDRLKGGVGALETAVKLENAMGFITK